MIYFLELIFFFIYSVALFLINNIYVLLGVLIFNIIVSIILKVRIIKHFKVLYKNLLFVIFIILGNLLFSNIKVALYLGIKLFLVIDYTYLMSFIFAASSIRKAFYYLFYPLKLFKVDINDLTLVVAIALAFIPILIDEAKMIKLSLQSKGLSFSFKNIITRPHIYLLTYLNGIFDRVDELEKTMKIKAY